MGSLGHNLMKWFMLAVVAMFLFSTRLEAQLTDFESADFRKADSVAALYPHHSLDDLKELSDKLTRPFSAELDKFRAIYKWVCNNIKNDYGLYVQNKNKREKLKGRPEALREWNKKFGRRVMQKLRHEHKTICTGYAYLLKELAYHAGIRCEIIDGYGRTAQANIGGPGIANHSWNAVQLDKQWYLCDATWSSGAIHPQHRKFIKQYNEVYFLAAPSLFVRNHYPLDTSRIYLKDKPTLHEFLNQPLVYRAALSYKILPVFPETFEVAVPKGEQLTFHFSHKGEGMIEKVELQIVQGTSLKSLYPDVYQDSDGLCKTDHVFSRKGTYVVHILHQGDHLFTYSVKVSK